MHFLILYKKALRCLDCKIIDLKDSVTLSLLTLCPTTSEAHGKKFGQTIIISTSLNRGTWFTTNVNNTCQTRGLVVFDIFLL